MFSRVILRRVDPVSAASGQADDIENQPLSPRFEEHQPEPQMTERSQGPLSRLMPRRPTIPSRFRFSNSTEATSAAGADLPGDAPGARASRANTHPALRPSSSHYPDDDDESLFDRDTQRESTLPSRYSVVVDLPSTRLHLPGLQRTWTQGSNGPPTARPADIGRPPLSPPCRPHTPPNAIVTEPQRAYAQPQASTTRLGSEEADGLYRVGDRRSRGAFTGADPAEAQLAELAEDGRRRRQRSGSGRAGRQRHERRRSDETPEQREERRRHRRARAQRIRDIEDGDEEGSERPHPKHFLFCFPWIKSRKVRSQILQCFVSGSFLVLLLTVYLALSATKNISNSEFSVLLILIILFATIFFCQGLIRLCLLIFRPKPTEERRRSRLPQMYGPSGYAVPRQPIRVVLARDEEAAGIESDATKTNPPAYGLWRESVRVDPNRIFWQRNTAAPPPTIEERELSEREGESSDSSAVEEGSSGSRRPPSYASEDGVSYIIEARPRSTLVPLGPEIVAMPNRMPSPLPIHPSEVGRIATPPSR
ncbi:hypothetical protein N0V93_000450 [Gnomoniopsis smithogilvyi]|uniref:Uncharacterized protein n=1 Tax=Gnomoniopsis smithogilvyi TaxID=1191159 RepID=A0A9W9D1R4_9PEZI|nr:hypothetical protein N0V93_000450 [Gnomoniopsis smithogilvyi]